MASRKSGFFLGAVGAVGAVGALVAAAGLPPQAAQAQQPVITPTAGAPIFAPPPGAPLSFADIFDRVSPAVVSINVTAIVDGRALGLPGLVQPRPRGAPAPRGR